MTSLGRQLLAIVLGALLPLLVLSAALAVLLVNNERASTERALTERANVLALAVEAELQRSLAALSALAGSDSLQRGDLKAFYARAGRLTRELGLWDNLL